jgi:hypothetical protein
VSGKTLKKVNENIEYFLMQFLGPTSQPSQTQIDTILSMVRGEFSGCHIPPASTNLSQLEAMLQQQVTQPTAAAAPPDVPPASTNSRNTTALHNSKNPPKMI